MEVIFNFKNSYREGCMFSHTFGSALKGRVYFYATASHCYSSFLDNEDQIWKDKGCVVSGVFVSVPCGVALY